MAESVTEPLPEELEADRRGKHQHDPVDLKPSYQAPDVAVQVGEEERREVPDGFLGAQLAQAAAGKAAADGERKRNPLTAEEGWRADHQPDYGPGVGPGEEAGEE